MLIDYTMLRRDFSSGITNALGQRFLTDPMGQFRGGSEDILPVIFGFQQITFLLYSL